MRVSPSVSQTLLGLLMRAAKCTCLEPGAAPIPKCACAMKAARRTVPATGAMPKAANSISACQGADCQLAAAEVHTRYHAYGFVRFRLSARVTAI